MRGEGTSLESVTARSAGLRASQAVVIVPVFLTVLFASMVLFLRAFEPEAAGFERRGLLLVLYHVARVGLVGFIAILCYSAGYRALEAVSASPARGVAGARATALACFFLGASLYGIAFTVLGLAGGIGLAAGLLLTVPMLLASYGPLTALADRGRRAAVPAASSDAHAPRRFVTFVMLAAALATGLFVLTRVLFIAVFDPNIWEHYLHYYRAVLASGSTQPNEIWHHFYASKGAGLIFLACVLSDFFGAQLASACFALAAGLIVFDVVREHGGGASWAWFGVVLFFAYLIGQLADGATFKHHMVLLGYASLAFWGCLRFRRATGLETRALMIVLIVSLGYFGFYVPAAAAVLSPAIALVAIGTARGRVGNAPWPLLAVAVAVGTGAGLAFVTNWLITGLAEVTPMRWFWAMADQARAERVFGLGGIEFFLARNNDLSATYDWTLARTWSVLRYPLRMELVLLALLVALPLMIRDRARGGGPGPTRVVAYAAAFVVPLALFAQAVQSESVTRMALYAIVLTTVVFVMALRVLIDTCLQVAVSPRLAGLAAAPGGAAPGWWRRGFRHAMSARVLLVIVILGGMTLATLDAWKKTRRERPVIPAYASGHISLKESFERVETRAQGLPVGIGVAEMARVRRTIPPGERILRLTYDGGFAYALPGDGIVSEPTYSLIRDPGRLLAGRPEEVITYLRQRGITHLTVNLQNNLFSTVAFTSLFDPRELPEHVGVVYEDGDRFVLTWREGKVGERPPSAYLLTLLELKRTGVLHHPFSKEVEGRLTGSGEDVLMKSVAEFDRTKAEFLDEVDRIAAEMQARLSLEAGRGVLRRALAAGRAAVDEREPRTDGGRLRALLGPEASRPLTERVRDRALRVTLLSLFRNAVYQEYVAELGDVIAWLSVQCDERVPFAREFPPDARCFR